MHIVEQDKFLMFENVAAFRSKHNTSNINIEVERFKKLIRDKGALEIGPMISTTYEVEEIRGRRVLDIEFLVQVDSKIDLEKPYRFIETFKLTNAIYTRYVGNPSEIEDVVSNMYSFINDNKLIPAATLYSVNINRGNASLNEMPIIDLYIPINPNKL